MNNYQCYLKQTLMSMEFVSQFEMLDCYSAYYIELSLKDQWCGCVTLHEVLDERKLKVIL